MIKPEGLYQLGKNSVLYNGWVFRGCIGRKEAYEVAREIKSEEPDTKVQILNIKSGKVVTL